MQSTRLRIGLLLVAFLLASPLSFAQTIRFVTTTGTNSNPADAISWASSTTNLQGAIDAVEAAGGGEVWVAAGVYKPGGNTNTDRTISFSMKNGVAIYGGFTGNENSLIQRPTFNPISGQPSSSTLSGEIGNPSTKADNSYHIIFNSGLIHTAVLNGFIVTGGNADGLSGNSANYYHGGGIYNNGADGICNPLFINCLFIANSAVNNGGVVYNDGSAGRCAPQFTDCSFLGNSASSGGAIFNDASNYGSCQPQLNNCLFIDNMAFSLGGAVCNYNSNSSGGTSYPLFINCSFLRNSARSGGAICNGGGSIVSWLMNCSFLSNSASSFGGAMYNSTSYGRCSPLLLNCSFQGNSAPLGGAMHNETYSQGSFFSTLTNCILFNNGGSNTINRYSDSPSNANIFLRATYSLFDQSVTGYNTTEPTNLTTLTSPFSSSTSSVLVANSSAINAGNTQFYLNGGTPTTDLAGNPRIMGTGIDMGAYEFQEITPLQLLAPQYSCLTGEFRFQSSGGDGSQVSYMAIGITGWNTSAGPFTIKPYCDAQPFLLLARQASDLTKVVAYSWNYKTTCPITCLTFPPSTTTALPLTVIAPIYNCLTGAFTFQSTGGDGSPVYYRAIGITDWTINLGPFTVKPYCDVQPFILEARQTNQPSVIKTYQWNYVTECPANCFNQLASGRQALAEKDVLSVRVLGNPTLDETVTLEVQTATINPLQIRVTNSQGQTVSSQNVEQSAGSQQIRMPLGKSAGVYLLQVSTPTQQKVVKVVRQ